MPTVAENLLALDAVKDEIKAKVGTNLGRTIGAAVPFTDYADYILPPVAWMPDPLWASLDDIADGQIGMIVRDRDDLGVAARCAFTITATANYVVDWGDGTSQTIASGTMADHTYTLGAGTSDSKGTTTFKVRISSTGTIQRILMASNVTGGIVKQTVQNVNIKAAGITSMASAFAYCYLLQSCTMVALPLCTTIALAFSCCTALELFGDIDCATCVSAASTFARCASILSIGNISLPECTSLFGFAQQALSLKNIGSINAPKCADLTNAFNLARNICVIGATSQIGLSATSVNAINVFVDCKYSGIVDLSGSKLSRIIVTGSSDALSGVTGLTFHASSAFGGASPQIDVQYTMMNRTALVALFNLLPTLVGKTINVTGCIGTADLTAGDRAIATGKGWTITG